MNNDNSTLNIKKILGYDSKSFDISKVTLHCINIAC